MPLRGLLVIPFALQLAGLVGLVSYLSYQNGQQTVANLSSRLRQESQPGFIRS